jgi:hypothetical protein
MNNPASPPTPSSIAVTQEPPQPFPSDQPTTTASRICTCPDSITSTPPAYELSCAGRFDVDKLDADYDHPKPFESCTCVIALSIERYPPYTCDQCGGEKMKDFLLGSLQDVRSANEGNFRESDVISSDDIVGDTQKIIVCLLMLARKQGYTHCELREYSFSDPLDYVPLFGGPLPVLGVSS